MVAATATLDSARSVRVVGLISVGHFLSHFYMLLLPPLFPVLREVYGVGYTELGLAITLFGLATALTQVPVGFLVDRFGARRLLIAGLFLQSLVVALIGLIPSYGALLVLMVVSGLANAVYHPANYSILNASVPAGRMGRAFSIHTFAGHVGNALAPVSILLLMALIGWQYGLVVCGILGVGGGLLLLLNRGLLDDAGRGAVAASGDSTATSLRLLFSAPIVMGLVFFVALAMAGKGISSFSIAVFDARDGMVLVQASMVLSAFLFASPVGVLSGGWLADRVRRHDIVVSVCFLAVAAIFARVAGGALSLPILLVLFAVAGFCTGLVAPSRDMMIRAVTPPGSMGKVFGFVSTGFNIGTIIAPPMFGLMLDHGEPGWVFWGVAVISLLTVATVLETGRRGRRLPARFAQPSSSGRNKRP